MNIFGFNYDQCEKRTCVGRYNPVLRSIRPWSVVRTTHDLRISKKIDTSHSVRRGKGPYLNLYVFLASDINSSILAGVPTQAIQQYSLQKKSRVYSFVSGPRGSNISMLCMQVYLCSHIPSLKGASSVAWFLEVSWRKTAILWTLIGRSRPFYQKWFVSVISGWKNSLFCQAVIFR